jgi:hypothetical protein
MNKSVEVKIDHKEELNRDLNLENYIGSVKTNGPYFEYPTIKFTPKHDSVTEIQDNGT